MVATPNRQPANNPDNPYSVAEQVPNKKGSPVVAIGQAAFAQGAPGAELHTPNEAAVDAVRVALDGPSPFRVGVGVDRAAPTTGAAETPRRTFLVDLAANLKVNHLEVGADTKSKQLKTLADLTSGNKTEIIVQSANSRTHLIDRYILHEGTITMLPSVKSKGFSGDLKGLMAMAPKNGELSLVIQSHGFAGGGVGGDHGYSSLTDLRAIIQHGLAASGRSQLDMLSLDSCSMGNSAPLAALSPLAKNLVASENTEFGSASQNGQPLAAIFQDVLSHPEESAGQVASRFVTDSGDSCKAAVAKDAKAECGTDTLFSYKTAAVGELTGALAQFGNALRASLSEPGNRAAIEAAIKATTDASIDDGQSSQLRDLQEFANNILARLNDKSIKDDAHGTLRKSAEGILQAQQSVVGDSFTRLDQHGLSVFLPSADYDPKSPQKLAALQADTASETLRTEGAALVALADKLAHGAVSDQDAKLAFYESMCKVFPAAGTAEISPALGALLTKVDNSGPDAPLPSQAVLRHLGQLLVKAADDSTKFRGEVIREDMRAADDTVLGDYEAQLSFEQPGWTDFILDLRGLSPPNRPVSKNSQN